MTQVQKITLASARDIPFNKLRLSQANVRQVKAGTSIDELAQSIARRGLIQSLHVRPIFDDEGKETGLFEVPAGGRRFRALELLVKQKRLAKNAPVPCIVSGADVLINEVSLAENIERAPLHPLDQFRAFAAMQAKGMSEEEIAAAFFVDVKVVKQRLRLASVSPVLLDAYARDAMTLEELMAFTVCADHQRQEQVWDAVKDSWQKNAFAIRRMLTESAVRASDKRALFVSIEAYEAAGGTVLRDLFEPDDGGWLQDPALLDQLVTEKLKAEAETIATEGWKWIGVSPSYPYGHTQGLRRLAGREAELTDEEQVTSKALREEIDTLEAQYAEADELPEEVEQRLTEIDDALAELASRPAIYDPAEVAIAGAYISIDGNGRLLVDRGYVRPEDEPQAEGEDGGAEADTDQPTTVISYGDDDSTTDNEETQESEVMRPLSERLLAELSAHRTLALRNAVATSPHVAMTALLHRLVIDCFQPYATKGCLEAQVREVQFPVQAEDLSDSGPARAIAERHEQLAALLPTDDAELWHWLTDQDDSTRMQLLAHCVSFGVNALHEKLNPHSGMGVSQHGLDVRLSQANRLARATGLDMVATGWRPTVANYLGRVTRPHIIEAVREGAGERAAELISHLKKADMAKEAERLLENSGWLPEPLRLQDDSAPEATDKADAQPDGTVELPAFLTDEDGDDASSEDEEEPMAAE